MKHSACIFVERGWVEIEKDAAYRYITDNVSKNFLESTAYLEKVDTFWPQVTPSTREPKFNYDKSKITIRGCYEVEKIRFITHYPEWAPHQVIEALKLLCEIQIYCIQNGLFVETHLWNFILKNGAPMLIDLGDFRPYHKNLDSTALGSITGSFRDKLDNHCPVYMSKFINNYLYIKTEINKICKNNSISLVEKFSLIREVLDKAETSTSRGYWSGYDKKGWSSISDIPLSADNKSKALCQEILDKKPNTIVDLGCNEGIYSFYAASLGSECVGIDSDVSSIEAANNFAKNSQLNCCFVKYDIMKPPKAWGLNGVYGSVEDRLTGEMVIAPAIFHHLYRQGHQSRDIINKIIKYSTKYVCIEFIPHNDQHIAAPATSWPNLESVVSQLDSLGYKVSVKDSSPSPRKWIFAEREEK